MGTPKHLPEDRRERFIHLIQAEIEEAQENRNRALKEAERQDRRARQLREQLDILREGL